MNSLQKQAQTQREKPEDFLQSFEQKLQEMQSLPEVETLMKKLQFLGLNFDPFQEEVPSECRQVMENLGLTPHLQNPYQATNILLRLLDKTEEQLNSLKQ